MAGPGVAPLVLAASPGVLDSEYIQGAPRALGRITTQEAHVLGALVHRAHQRRTSRTAWLPGWTSRPRSPAAYARARGRGATARARTAPERHLAQRAAQAAASAAPHGGDTPFRLLHGDLVAANVVWGPGGPVLVDWEFWRMGDPVEDLAYLEAVNDVPARVRDAIRAGYGADAAMATRIDSWHTLVLLDAALWYRDAGEHDRAARLMRRARA